MNFVSDKLCENSGLAINEENIWYITNLESLLMRVDIQTGTIVCMGKLPNSKRDCAYRTLNYQDGKLFCIPFLTDSLCIYDIEKKAFEIVSFPKSIKDFISGDLCFFGSFFYKDELVMYGIHPIIIRYNIATKEFKFHHLKKMKEKKVKCCFWRDGFGKDSFLYIPMVLHKSVVKINIIDDSITILGDMDIEECNVITVKSYKDKIIYVYYKDGKVLLESFGLDFEKKYIICSFSSDDIIKTNDDAFLWGDIIENKIILLPWMSLDMYCVNLDTGEFEKISCASEGILRPKCFCGVIVDQSVFSVVAEEKKLYLFDNINHILKKRELIVCLEEKRKVMEIFAENMKNGKIMLEQEKIFGIQEFIVCL